MKTFKDKNGLVHKYEDHSGRYVPKRKQYTDDYYEKREQELLAMSEDELTTHFSERELSLTEWLKSREGITHLELKQEFLTVEEYHKYLNTVLST